MAQPLYLQIAQQLREHILNEKYPLNARIPTEKELAVAMGAGGSVDPCEGQRHLCD